MAGQLRTLLASIELSPRTPCRKQWSTAHNLRASLCMEEFCFMSEGVVFFICSWQSVREVEVILGHKTFPLWLFLCLFWERIVLFPVLSDILIEQRWIQRHVISVSLSLTSMCLEKAEFGAISWQRRYITGYYFPGVLIKILIALLCWASRLQSICEEYIK